MQETALHVAEQVAAKHGMSSHFFDLYQEFREQYNIKYSIEKSMKALGDNIYEEFIQSCKDHGIYRYFEKSWIEKILGLFSNHW